MTTQPLLCSNPSSTAERTVRRQSLRAQGSTTRAVSPCNPTPTTIRLHRDLPSAQRRPSSRSAPPATRLPSTTHSTDARTARLTLPPHTVARKRDHQSHTERVPTRASTAVSSAETPRKHPSTPSAPTTRSSTTGDHRRTLAQGRTRTSTIRSISDASMCRRERGTMDFISPAGSSRRFLCRASMTTGMDGRGSGVICRSRARRL